MLHTSRVAHGLLAVLRQELAKLPAYTTHKLRCSTSHTVAAAADALDFLLRGNEATSRRRQQQQQQGSAAATAGDKSNDNDAAAAALQERKRQHRTMYEAILREQARKAAAAEQAALAARTTWWQRAQYRLTRALRDARAAVSTRAGVMALLQHCTASHAAEVALEQGIDVKDVHLVVEQRAHGQHAATAALHATRNSRSATAATSLTHEDVIVGYIDAPRASADEVAAFAARLQRACPMARQMTIEWRHGAPPSMAATTAAAAADVADERDGALGTAAASTSASTSTADAAAVAQQELQQAAATASIHADDNNGNSISSSSSGQRVPAGMPGAWRRNASHGSVRSSNDADDDYADDTSLHLPLGKRKATTAATARRAAAASSVTTAHTKDSKCSDSDTQP